jgi:hypothetical protein
MLIHEAHNEQRLAFQIHRDPGSKLRDFEGLQLLEIPIESGAPPRFEWAAAGSLSRCRNVSARSDATATPGRGS